MGHPCTAAAQSAPARALAPIEITTQEVILGEQIVLAPLRLTLNQRRIAIIGRNGSGKSTFLRLIAGLIAAKSGTVAIDGADIFKDRRAALRHIGILFQNPEHQILFPTVIEELSFGLTQMGETKAQAQAYARAALKARGRAHWENAAITTLSGGQKQYLCLLSLLLMAPETLLLDEPFASLDPPSRLRLRRELAALPQRVIVITHAPDELADFDRVIWLENGKIRLDDCPARVLPQFNAEMERLAAQDADTDLTN